MKTLYERLDEAVERGEIDEKEARYQLQAEEVRKEIEEEERNDPRYY